MQIIALDPTTPQLRAPPSGSTYAAPRAIVMTPETLTGSTATSSLSIAQTWNTTGTPTAFNLNVTDTASNAASLLMDLRVGGVSRMSVTKTGQILGASGTVTAPTITVSGALTTGFGFRSTLPIVALAGVSLVEFSGGVRVGSTGAYQWTASAGADAAADLILARDAAGTLAQRNGVNAQTFRVYNTFTDASNYERGKVEWASNVLRIGTEKLGTGAARALEFQTDGTTRLTIATTGNITTSAAVIVGGDTYLNGLSNVALRGSSTGIALIANTSFNDFTRLQLGGTTNSFSAIARDGAGVSFVGAAGGSTAHIKVPGVAVASLPAAATAGVGARSFVTDATAPVFGSAVTGGGAVAVPVYSTGTAWNVG